MPHTELSTLHVFNNLISSKYYEIDTIIIPVLQITPPPQHI